MTWPEWLESVYNDGSFKKTGSPTYDGEPGSYIEWTYDNNVFGGGSSWSIHFESDCPVASDSETGVLGEDLIVPGFAYVTANLK